MNGLAPKQLAGAAAIVGVVAAGMLFLSLRHAPPPVNPPRVMPAAKSGYEEFVSRSDESLPEVVVHVAGRVVKPGVYSLPAGSRVNDALKVAGGALPESDLDNVNLAGRLEDGEQVYIARARVESPPAVSVTRTHEPRPATDSSSGRPRANGGSGKKEVRPGKLDPASGQKVNINSAGPEELQRLPGVGPSTARQIVEYRAGRGKFSNLEQLDEIPGIGPSRLEKLRPLISF